VDKAPLKFLENLIATPSPSGFETGAQRVFADYVKPHCDEFSTDAYGNAFARLGNPDKNPHIVLAGHIDELGFMVSHINEDGFLFVQGIGGIDRALFRGQRVHVHGPKGTIQGVTGSLAIHLQEASAKVRDVTKLISEIAGVSFALGIELTACCSVKCELCKPVWRSELLPKLYCDFVGVRLFFC
jgi:endoglucanase